MPQRLRRLGRPLADLIAAVDDATSGWLEEMSPEKLEKLRLAAARP